MIIGPPADRAEHHRALALLLDRPDLSPGELNHHVETLHAHARRHQFSLEHCLVAREGGAIVCSCLCVDAPGRTASVFVPSARPHPAVVPLLHRLAGEAAGRGVRMMQAIIDPASVHEGEAYRLAGFEPLSRLLYMACDLTQRLPAADPPLPLSWLNYDERVHELFARVIVSTYEASLDCGSLNGRRHIDDILASHRATGRFDPRFWLLALEGDEPVGVILLAEMPELSSWELVYMGVVPARRKRRFAAAILRRGLELVRDQAAVTMTLTVDAGNVPALKLYRHFGFRERMQRDAWIKLLPES